MYFWFNSLSPFYYPYIQYPLGEKVHREYNARRPLETSMKRSALAAVLAAMLLLPACGPAAATPTPIDVSAISTSAVETAYTGLTQSAPTATILPTLAATDTPTATATLDLSVIKFDLIYFQQGNVLVVTFKLNGVRGEFSGEGNGYLFECSTLPEAPDVLRCVGDYQAPGRELFFHLLTQGSTIPILEVELIIPNAYPSTPEGMWCEIEPLWVAPLTGPEGCYAVTCYRYGVFVNEGTPNTCDQPWYYGPVP